MCACITSKGLKDHCPMSGPGGNSSPRSATTAGESKDNQTHGVGSKRVSGSSQHHPSRRRRRMAPPSQLGWPGQYDINQVVESQTIQTLSSLQDSSATNDSQDNSPEHKQQPKNDFFSPRRSKKSRATDTLSTPSRRMQYITEPASAASTVDSVKQGDKANSLWVDKHAPLHTKELVVAPKKVKQVKSWLEEQMNNGGLLILVGAPGIGKSAMVHTLGRELKWDIQEWSESFYQFDTSSNRMEQLPPIRHWEQFLHQNSIGYQSLELLHDEHSNSKASIRPAKRKLMTSHDPPNIGQRLILLDELPYCHTTEMKESLQEALTEHIRTSAVPTVLVWSQNVLEGKHNPADLEALVDRKILYSNLCTILQINPATIPKFQSSLSRVAQAECVSVSKEYIQELHVRSAGDIRFALQMMQFERGDDKAEAWSPSKRIPKSTDKTSDRDVRLSTFHALGKLLYAKRQKRDDTQNQPTNGIPTQDAPLDFDPEGAIEHSGMELTGSIHFLQYHSIDFFHEDRVEEISDAWSLYSDAAMMMNFDRMNLSSSSASLSAAVSSRSGVLAAAGSLAGRAVASSRKTPVQNKFRQFSKPKSFEVMATRKANQWRLDHYYTNKENRFNHSKEAFATDVYPYIMKMRGIGQSLADRPGSFWDNPPLQSFLHPSDGQKETKKSMEGDDEWKKEQDEILEVDDIDDF